MDNLSTNENLRAVYEQYWLHARHVEHETWLFTSIYGIVAVAIFATVGAPIDLNLKIAVAIFGSIFSFLAYLIIYTLHIPFLNYYLTTEVLAIREFKLPNNFRRFFPLKKILKIKEAKDVDDKEKYEKAIEKLPIIPGKFVTWTFLLSIFFMLLTSIFSFIVSLLLTQKIEYWVASFSIPLIALILFYPFKISKDYKKIRNDILINNLDLLCTSIIDPVTPTKEELLGDPSPLKS